MKREDHVVLWMEFRSEGGARATAEHARAIVGVQRGVVFDLEAAETLTTQRISIEAIDPRADSPFDFDAIRASVSKTWRLIAIEGSYARCALATDGAAVRSPLRA